MVKRWLDVRNDLPLDERTVLVDCPELPDVAMGVYRPNTGWGVYVDGKEQNDIAVRSWRDIPSKPINNPNLITFRSAAEARYLTNFSIDEGDNKELTDFYTIRIGIMRAISRGEFSIYVSEDYMTTTIYNELLKCGYIIEDTETSRGYKISWGFVGEED